MPCDDCRFWDEGFCRRTAPVAGNVSDAARWPLTLTSDWCGEWRRQVEPIEGADGDLLEEVKGRGGAGLSIRARNALRRAGATRLADLQGITTRTVAAQKNCGRATMHEVAAMMDDHGYTWPDPGRWLDGYYRRDKDQ